MRNRTVVEFLVGSFMLLGALALAFLALKVSGLSANGDWFSSHTYTVSVSFPNIGSLKVRAPVRIGGVEVGTVSSITLNSDFFADVQMKINQRFNNIPANSMASIASSGLLGDNYVSISPGFSKRNLTNGSTLPPGTGAQNLINLLATFAGSKSKSESDQPARSAPAAQ